LYDLSTKQQILFYLKKSINQFKYLLKKKILPASKHFTVKSGIPIKNSDGFRKLNATAVQLVPVRCTSSNLN